MPLNETLKINFAKTKLITSWSTLVGPFWMLNFSWLSLWYQSSSVNLCLLTLICQLWVYLIKIPHTGDIESLDRCGLYVQYNFGEFA